MLASLLILRWQIKRLILLSGEVVSNKYWFKCLAQQEHLKIRCYLIDFSFPVASKVCLIHRYEIERVSKPGSTNLESYSTRVIAQLAHAIEGNADATGSIASAGWIINRLD